jgi:predicted metalloprotease with PDZ domain
MRVPLATAVILGVLPMLAGAEPAPQEGATYRVRLTRSDPPRFHVTATLPAGDALRMEETRPGDIPEILERGWPALVSSLRAVDAGGRSLELGAAKETGWDLPRELQGVPGRWTLDYDVDASLLAARGYPAPREAMFAGGDAVSLVGRSLFVTTSAVRSSVVTFEAPPGFRAFAPWARRGGARRQEFLVPSRERLVENLIVLTRSEPESVEAGGFRLIAVPFGAWRSARRDVREVLRAHVRRFVKEMAFTGAETYLIVLLPQPEPGGEAYRQSFALTVAEPPSRSTRPDWGNRIGHELFHYWNGWMLVGADYKSSQWLQEGFTEYFANVSMAATRLVGEEWLRAKLAEHVRNYRRLATSLEDYGTTKGPPLYSGGALVAFHCDVAIRDATGGAKSLGDFFRALERRTDRGARPYTTADVLGALEETASLDWSRFFEAYVRGREPLPLGETFRAAGLRSIEGPDGAFTLEPDREATAAARTLWAELSRDR